MSNQKTILDILKPTTSKEIVQDTHATFIELKAKGQELIKYVDSVVMTFEAAEKYQKLSTKMQKTYEAMRNYQAITRLLVEKGQAFEETLNRFLGREVHLTYVDDKGNLIIVEEAKVGLLYQQVTKNKGRGNMSAARFKKTVNEQQLSAEFQSEINEIAARKKGVYVAALNRYTQTIKELNEKKYFWTLENKREYSPSIGNKGRIAEAYAEAVLTEDNAIDNSRVEHGLQALVRHIEEDNVGAAIKGDVQIQDNGKIHFAIKEGSFSTPRIGQFYALAVNLQDVQEITPEELEKQLEILTNVKQIANKIEDSAFNFADENIMQEIKSLGIKVS